MCLPQHMETPPNPYQDHWNWQHFLDCRDLRRDVDTKLNAPRFGRLDKICALSVCEWSVNDSPQRALTASDLCFHSLVEHSQPMDAHRLMSSEPQFPPTPTCIISASLQDIQECLYTLCICTRPVCLQIVRVLSELVRLSACVRLCMHQCTCRLVSVCGSS